MDRSAPSILKPTVIGGVSAAIVSSIPLVACLNLLCCSLVVAGGFFAGFLYSKECAKQGFTFGPANGATVGLVAGLFYAIADSIISGLIDALGFTPDLDQFLDRVDQADLPPEYVEWGTWVFERMVGFSIFHFLLILLFAAVFCTIGGLIAGVAFKVEPAPPSAGMAPPPPPFEDAGPSDPQPPQA